MAAQPPLFDITRFGAVADGRTDCTAAIEAAARPPAEPVTSPPGPTRVELEAERAALQEEQAGLEDRIDT